MFNCANCKHGEPCNVPGNFNYIHCNKFNVSLTKKSLCMKWEAKDGSRK